MTIKSALVWKSLFIVYVVTVMSHILAVYMEFGPTRPQLGENLLLDMFYFTHEKSIAALFSSTLFLILSVCFHKVSTIDLDLRKYWAWLRNISIYLACDEWFAIHDAALNVYGVSSFGVPYWVLIYGIIFAGIALVYIKFLLKVSKYLLTYLICSATVFITGAAIMETVTYKAGAFNSLKFHAGLLLEDGLEMAGILIMIYGCIKFLEKKSINVITLPKVTTLAVMFIGVADLLVTYILKLSG